MILPVGKYIDKKISFNSKSEDENKLAYDKDTLLKNNFVTRTRIGMNKLTKAFTEYPAKGLVGE